MRTRPCVRPLHLDGHLNDLRAGELRARNAGVQLVLANFPAPTDDSTNRIVQPRRRPANLDLLTARQPVLCPDQSILEHDEEVLELLVEKRRAREAQRHAHHLRVVAIEIQRANHARLAIVFGAHLQLVDADHSARHGDAQRVREREVVGLQPLSGQRVRDVLHLVAVSQTDDRRKVVLDDAQVVPVVLDVRGQQGCVAPADNALLAQVRGAPVHLERELVRLDHLGRLPESFTQLRQERQIAVRRGLVVHEAAVGKLLRPPVSRLSDERERARIVPLLRTRYFRMHGRVQQQEHQCIPNDRCCYTTHDACRRSMYRN